MNFHFEEEQKKEKRKKLIKGAVCWLVEIAIVILGAYLLVHFCFIRSSMVGSSMEDTLVNGQDIIISKISYLILSPGRGDIIAFYQTDEEDAWEESLLTVRRIVGLPGEKVKIENGKVFINGEEIEEKYEMPLMESGGLAQSELTLGKDEYFVLGDSRNDSEDSRFRSFGNVKKKNIAGQVVFKKSPFSLIGGPTIENKKEESEG